MANEALEHADYVARGEGGEQLMAELIEALSGDRELDSIAGLSFRRDGMLEGASVSGRSRICTQAPATSPHWRGCPGYSQSGRGCPRIAARVRIDCCSVSKNPLVIDVVAALVVIGGLMAARMLALLRSCGPTRVPSSIPESHAGAKAAFIVQRPAPLGTRPPTEYAWLPGRSRSQPVDSLAATLSRQGTLQGRASDRSSELYPPRRAVALSASRQTWTAPRVTGVAAGDCSDARLFPRSVTICRELQWEASATHSLFVGGSFACLKAMGRTTCLRRVNIRDGLRGRGSTVRRCSRSAGASLKTI